MYKRLLHINEEDYIMQKHMFFYPGNARCITCTYRCKFMHYIYYFLLNISFYKRFNTD